jgi:GT2 family glycosyltransferase
MTTQQQRPQVAVGIVTYGKRWHLLEKVLATVRADADVSHVVVYNNGAIDPIAELVVRAGWQQKVTVLEGGSNLGSATGYAGVLAHLHALPGTDLLLLLDDDNRPEAGAIGLALDHWLKLGGQALYSVLFVRNDRPEQSQALASGRPLRHCVNSFLGFSLARALQKRRAAGGAPSMPVDAVEVDFAPYGGFLFHRSWIDKVGLPRREYFVYADDHEYTTRITRAGGIILLLGASRVEDLETSWFLKPAVARAGLLSEQGADARLYYSVRNRVNFERAALISSRPVYFMNVVVALTAQFFKAVRIERAPRQAASKLALVLRAIRDGWAGRLGRRVDL